MGTEMPDPTSYSSNLLHFLWKWLKWMCQRVKARKSMMKWSLPCS